MNLRQATVYRVKAPCAPGYLGKWCVAWQTEVMPGLAFWYFDTRREAREAAAQIRGGQ